MHNLFAALNVSNCVGQSRAKIRATDKRRKMLEFKEDNASDARKMQRDSDADADASDCASGDRHACSARSTNACSADMFRDLNFHHMES